MPDYIAEEQKRELLQHSTSRLIWGEGHPFAPIFVVLDNPGAREDNLGKPFLCGTRETLQKGVIDAGIDLDDLYISYLLKSRPVRKYDKETARRVSRRYLVDQILRHRPEIVVCLGDVVVRSYFDDKEASVKALRGYCHSVYGIKTIVSYHPLAVRRRPVLFRNFVDDWALVASELTALP